MKVVLKGPRNDPLKNFHISGASPTEEFSCDAPQYYWSMDAPINMNTIYTVTESNWGNLYSNGIELGHHSRIHHQDVYPYFRDQVFILMRDFVI